MKQVKEDPKLYEKKLMDSEQQRAEYMQYKIDFDQQYENLLRKNKAKYENELEL